MLAVWTILQLYFEIPTEREERKKKKEERKKNFL